MTRELGSRARALALPYYADALPAHDRFHAGRVHDVALRLADECEEPVDRDVLAAAAWFHDAGRPLERAGEIDDHAAWGATEAKARLEREVEAASADRIAAVERCIRAHSIRASSPEPETLEAKLLFDADKLDAAGARGLVRLACIVGERSGRANEAYAVIDDAAATAATDAGSSDRPDVTLLREWARERLDALYTSPGRRVGESRWQFMEEFFAQFARELEGSEGSAQR
ncbi:HD domain-containing protein [Halopiger xanaduensis]|uniref:Metal dependent phosphohydrolase n=1 Tax=Halopiger xanaduensis (strain DSM 18323 / JCM 14033 / SH-6) TaxID=797210 RepID=F8DBJ4_HALXS|nr:HD domain-containing protein [Halopiger xanaduensis]AEH37119.1 metal dependent phosphohydrolase [Halopiger xanaduensis SH-6]